MTKTDKEIQAFKASTKEYQTRIAFLDWETEKMKELHSQGFNYNDVMFKLDSLAKQLYFTDSIPQWYIVHKSTL